ncbi:MAG: tetratricopeptide repeat protein [Pyramidobacter sp.]|nr:tetratricopeptide repeat protein [Pyramidobacter sp.]
MFRKICAVLTAAALLATGAFAAAKTAPAPVSASERRAERLFIARDWKGMDSLLQSGEKLTPRALSLAANALWYQKKYAESLELMKKVGSRYPKSVAPYARLLTALACERTEKKKEAYTTALALWKDKTAPALTKYYAMYALFRLTETVDEKEKWLRRMMAAASDKARIGAVCRELNALGRMTPDDALALLKVEPQNAAALKIAAKAPDSPQKFYRLGYAAHLRGDHKTAVANLSKLKLHAPYGESGTYYLCVSLQRLDRSVEAEPLLEQLVLKKDSEYMSRGMSRLRLMLGGKAHDAALAGLLAMSEHKNEAIAKQALYTLAVSRWEKADQARDLYLERYPEGNRANNLRWSRGWARFRAGEYDEALENWHGAGESSAQLLYWRAKAHDELGESEKAAELRETLLKKHPLTVYAFLTEPEGSLEISDAPPAQRARAVAGERAGALGLHDARPHAAGKRPGDEGPRAAGEARPVAGP